MPLGRGMAAIGSGGSTAALRGQGGHPVRPARQRGPRRAANASAARPQRAVHQVEELTDSNDFGRGPIQIFRGRSGQSRN
jgi:hypothetical protein